MVRYISEGTLRFAHSGACRAVNRIVLPRLLRVASVRFAALYVAVFASTVCAPEGQFATDSVPEGDGFELPVPHQIHSRFRDSSPVSLDARHQEPSSNPSPSSKESAANLLRAADDAPPFTAPRVTRCWGTSDARWGCKDRSAVQLCELRSAGKPLSRPPTNATP